MTQKALSLLFTTWEGGGSVTPALEAARRMIARGHDVRVMSDEANRPETEAAGARFVPWTRAPNRPDRSRETEILQDWKAPPGPDGMIAAIETIFCGPALAYAEDVAVELRREPADLAVCNDLLFGTMVGCEALGQPFVVLAPNVSLAPLPGAPPMGPGFTPARDEAERAMHAEAAQRVVGMFDVGLASLNAARAAFGLAPLAHVFDQYEAAGATLLATARAFDFPVDVMPPKVRYVGPLIGHVGWARPWASPFPADDVRPLVAVSFSTTFQNHGAVLQRVIDALGTLPVRAAVTLGGIIRPEELNAPANVALLHSAPHDALMRAAAAVVCHGGHGTVIRALAHGRPQLVIPHGRDQNDNAARIAWRGAGLTLDPTADTAAIRAALVRLLEEPALAETARTLGAAVAAEAAAPTLVEALEAAAQPARMLEKC